MNKNAIKKFAIDARNKLIASVTDKAGMLGITPDNCSEAITKGADFEVYKTAAGTEVTLNKKQCEQRRKLVDQIHARGFEAVVEEVAYTWFNRICAIRFMEVNDYMYPVRVRVLSSEKEGKNEPDVVTMAPEIDWDFTDKEREEIIDAKMNNRLDDLFRMLFIKQCNLLHEVLPGLFEETEDYTEMLLNISFTNEADVIRMLVDGIDEKAVAAVDQLQLNIRPVLNVVRAQIIPPADAPVPVFINHNTAVGNFLRLSEELYKLIFCHAKIQISDPLLLHDPLSFLCNFSLIIGNILFGRILFYILRLVRRVG